jgi:putative transposase
MPRVVGPQYPHHITQRGNHRLDIFIDDDDRAVYLKLLRQYRDKHGLEILAYCLMSNHIHLVAVPTENHSLSRALADTHMRYAQHINRKYSKVGHLWQSRFFSCILDEDHTLAAARYVERNPVRAGLVGRAWDYPWSSAREHIDRKKDALVSARWPLGDLREQWAELLTATDDTKELEAIRTSTLSGKPVGTEAFIKKMEKLLQRLLKPREVGRPRKSL